MVVKVNGFNNSGAFQTGRGEVIEIITLHHAEPTGVVATRAQLVADGLLSNAALSGSNTVTVNGVTYSADPTYDDALWAQQNFDKILSQFTRYVNVVYIETDTAVNLGAAPGATLADPFRASSEAIGADYNAVTAADAWKIKVFTEQKGALNAVPVVPTASENVFVKGEASLGAAADNYGTSVESLAKLFDGLELVRTSEDDAYADAGPDGAGDAGGVFTVWTSTNADATRVNMVFDVQTTADLQS